MDLSEYLLESLRTDGELILYRGRRRRPASGTAPSTPNKGPGATFQFTLPSEEGAGAQVLSVCQRI